MAHILLVEDDPTIRKVLGSDLELEGYTVTTAKDGVEGLDSAKTLKPDLIILDLNLPKMSGYDVCRWLRKDGYQTPIIMLTAKSHEAEKVLGLDVGADDYIAKPYGSMELLARVRSLLRRLRRHKREEETVPFQFDDILVDFRRMAATKNGKPLALTTKEFQILELLIKRAGEVITRDQFLEQVWGYEEKPTTRTVDNRLMDLRRKLSPEDAEAYIVSVHGSGYKFIGAPPK